MPFFRGSPLARNFCAACLALIVFTSLYPFSGWRNAGVPPLAFLDAPFPRYWTVFDLAINILGYMPLGFLVVLSLGTPWPRPVRVIAAGLATITLSLSLEVLQTWLPTRVPSHVDLTCNSIGGILGALIAAGWGERWVRFINAKIRPRLRKALHAEWAAVLIALWVIGQLTPDRILFGSGDLHFFWPDILTVTYSPHSVHTLEMITVAAQMLAVGLLARHLISNTDWMALPALLLFFVTTLALKAISLGAILGIAAAFDWFTTGARYGLLIGCFALSLAIFLPERARLILAGIALLIGTLTANLTPETPYAIEGALNNNHGAFFNFVGIARWVNVCWPLMALVYFRIVLTRKRQPVR